MWLRHQNRSPRVDPSAYVAPNVVLSGDVQVGRNARILFGAILTGEGGPIVVGQNSIIMEGAILRATAHHHCTIGNGVLVGPRAYLSGCVVADAAFIATGATVLNGATIGHGAELRINSVTHIRTEVPEGAMVPIGWVAVGNPVRILPPHLHEEIWAVQKELDFPTYVFNVERGDPVAMNEEMCSRYGAYLGRHKDDVEESKSKV